MDCICLAERKIQMSKQAERDYLHATGDAGRQHNLGKPFTDQYCAINLASMGAIMALLPPPPARILDMGCGAGWTSIFFAKRGYEVVGQDISDDMIALAEENRARQGVGHTLSFICGDYEAIDHANAFDAVIFFDCLHHADDETAALRAARAALRTGGLLVTHEPGEGHSTAPGSIEAMQIYGVNERDMPPRLIRSTGTRTGFGNFRVYPMPQEIYDQFYGEDPANWPYRVKLRKARRVLRMLFKPCDRASGIVTMRAM